MKSNFDHLPLVPADQVKAPPGLPTGAKALDEFLLWQGLPLGELSLFQGSCGTGATSLWLRSVAQIHKQQKWAAWINGDEELFPNEFLKHEIDLKRLLVVEKPVETDKLFWLLQELISSSLFEVVGCSVNEFFFKNHQLQKLKNLCRRHKVALVFLNHTPMNFISPLLALSILFKRDKITIQRAQHRPTPFSIPGNQIHENPLHQLQKSTRPLLS